MRESLLATKVEKMAKNNLDSQKNTNLIVWCR
jgi:hypothetical protein